MVWLAMRCDRHQRETHTRRGRRPYPSTVLMRRFLGVLVWLAVGTLPAWTTDREIEFLDFDLGDVLAPESPLLRPGMHVHDCGDALDVYVTERVPLIGGIRVASRRASLRAYRTLAAFVYGTVGSREQETVYAETSAGGEAVGMSIRNRVSAAGVVAGLRPAARVLDGESLLMVFVLPLSGAHPTADCPPGEAMPHSESRFREGETHDDEGE